MRRGVEKAIVTHTWYSILMNILVFVRFRFLCDDMRKREVSLRSYSLDPVRVTLCYIHNEDASTQVLLEVANGQEFHWPLCRRVLLCSKQTAMEPSQETTSLRFTHPINIF